MRVLKGMVTVVAAAMLLVVCLVAEAGVLARQTVLQPSFYDGRQQTAYLIVSQALLRQWTGWVLAAAPADALRTTDPEDATVLAAKALPPERIAAVLAGSAPEVVRYGLEGGEMPVLLGVRSFPAMEDDLAQALLKPGLWQSLSEKPTLSLVIPFTAEWNAGNGDGLEQMLRPVRLAWAVWDNGLIVLAMVIAGLVGVLRLLWRRSAAFGATLGTVLLANGLLAAAPALLLSFASGWTAEQLAALTVLTPVTAFLGQEFDAFCLSVLEPLRGPLAVAAMALLSLSMAAFTAEVGRPAASVVQLHKRGVKEPLRD